MNELETECPTCKGAGRCYGPRCQGGKVLTDEGEKWQAFIERCIDRYMQSCPSVFGKEE